MGIPSCRFVSDQHEQFICAICLDVSDNPVVTKECEHIFCASCINSTELIRCPACNQELESAAGNSEATRVISGLLRRVYYNMKLRCLNPTCDTVLLISDYENHDASCPITFDICNDCEFKQRRSPDNNHSCVKVLKFENKILIKEQDEIRQDNENLRQEVENVAAKLEKLLKCHVNLVRRLDVYGFNTEALKYERNSLNQDWGDEARKYWKDL